MRRKTLWIAALLALGVLMSAPPPFTAAQPDRTYQFADIGWGDRFTLLTCDSTGCDYEHIKVGPGIAVQSIFPSDLPGHITLVRHSFYEDETRLTTVDLTGETGRNFVLPVTTASVGYFSITPDGAQIALSPPPGRGYQTTLWRATPDAETPYTLNTTLDGYRAQWSPDGRYVVYENVVVDPVRFGNERPHSRVMLYEPEGHGLYRLAISSDLYTDCYAPLWWSDNVVVYRCVVPGYAFDPVFRINLATHEVERWLEPDVPGCLHLAPDRTQLAFLAPENHFYIWDIATQTMQTITPERRAPSCSAVWVR